MSVLDLLYPDAALIVGVEDDADGSLRVYLYARWKGIHTHVDDEAAKDAARRAWNSGGHVVTRVPRTALCDCPAPGSPS